MVGLVFAGDVVGGAVVGARSYEGKAQGEIDGGVEA